MRFAQRMMGPVDAVRLTIRYSGDRFEVIKRTRVRKVVRPSAALLDDEEEFGCWAEVRSGGRSVYRQLLVDKIGRDVEVFTSDPDRPVSRIPVADPVGTFTIVVPIMDDADEIAIVGPPRTPPAQRRSRAAKASEAAARRVGDLATFSLSDEPKGGAQ